MEQRIVPNIWCTRNAEEAGAFYASAFENAHAEVESRYPLTGLLDYRPDLVVSVHPLAQDLMLPAIAEWQQEARDGMARGDDRYLRESDRGPQKRFLRDTIDARFSLGEFLLPLMFLVIFVTFIPMQELAFWAMGFIWAYLAASIVDALIVANGIKRKLAAAVGPKKVERGIIFATLARAMQLRVLRMPRARVRRGERIVYTGQ